MNFTIFYNLKNFERISNILFKFITWRKLKYQTGPSIIMEEPTKNFVTKYKQSPNHSWKHNGCVINLIWINKAVWFVYIVKGDFADSNYLPSNGSAHTIPFLFNIKNQYTVSDQWWPLVKHFLIFCPIIPIYDFLA